MSKHSRVKRLVVKPTLEWHFDQAAIDHEAATDGWYCLLTNLSPAEADAGEVLVRYKGQEVVERRYGNFKGPIAVAIFLKDNRRIEALLTVICLALLIFLPGGAPGPPRHRTRADDDRLPRPPQGPFRGPPHLSRRSAACSRPCLRHRAARRPGANEGWPPASSAFSKSTPRRSDEQGKPAVIGSRRPPMYGTPG